MRIGVDLGTTRTVVSIADRGNYPVVSFTDASGDAREWYPSVIAARDGELRFGYDAVDVAADPSWTVMRSFKRLMSDASASPDMVVRIGDGIELPMIELLTRFLGALREAIVTRSNAAGSPGGGASGAGRRAKGRARSGPAAAAETEMVAVVGVPANAHGTQRFLTLDAFRRAGFEVRAMMNEPSAAGFEYTHRHRDTLTSKREHVVVYDLGGGTFDASLVRMSGPHHDVVATSGMSRLGGDDFDELLAALVLDRAGLAARGLDRPAFERLLEQCRDAKERLNPNSRRIAIDLHDVLAEAAPMREVAVSVSDYYEACAALIEQTVGAMEPLIAKLPTEGDAIATLDDIAGIYVVGGASSLPPIARTLRERYGRRVHRSPYPSAATAIGLAIACDSEQAGFELTDRLSRSFGVFREGQAGREVTYDPIFTREEPLPAASADPVVRRRRYRAAHNLGHFRFVECASERSDAVGDVAPFGDVLFPFDPDLGDAEPGSLRTITVRRTHGDGPLVEETYSLDAHGIVHVRIANLDTGLTRDYRLGDTYVSPK